jgi:hypothetical protein
LQWKMLVNFMLIWSILLPFNFFMAIGYILWSFWYIFPLWYICCTMKTLYHSGHSWPIGRCKKWCCDWVRRRNLRFTGLNLNTGEMQLLTWMTHVCN